LLRVKHTPFQRYLGIQKAVCIVPIYRDIETRSCSSSHWPWLPDDKVKRKSLSLLCHSAFYAARLQAFRNRLSKRLATLYLPACRT